MLGLMKNQHSLMYCHDVLNRHNLTPLESNQLFYTW